MTVSMRTISLVMIAMFSAYGCKSSEFTGSSGQKPAVEKKPLDQKDEPKKDKPVDPNDPDAPIETEKDPPVNETEEVVDPEIGTDTDNSNKPSLLDLIAGLKKILIPDDTIDDENRVVFGNAKGFHIGDGAFSPDSNCSGFLTIQPISGTKYFFEFEVKLDDTVIDIGINEVCGVDYNDSNFASIEDSAGKSLQKKTIVGNNAIKYDSITLKAGKYKMVIESTKNAANNDDRDDFFVKKLEIKSNKPIKAGKVGAL